MASRSDEPQVEIVRFENPGMESRLHLPRIAWPRTEDHNGSKLDLQHLLRETFERFGPVHSVYADLCSIQNDVVCPTGLPARRSVSRDRVDDLISRRHGPLVRPS